MNYLDNEYHMFEQISCEKVWNSQAIYVQFKMCYIQWNVLALHTVHKVEFTF